MVMMVEVRKKKLVKAEKVRKEEKAGKGGKGEGEGKEGKAGKAFRFGREIPFMGFSPKTDKLGMS